VNTARALAALVLAPLAGVRAQAVPFSQRASVTQRLGNTEVTIAYGRPNARGRKLFGGVVPWGEVWCPGADQATAISLSNDLLVGGQRLAAGNYSVWAIPDTAEWTLIFSRAANVFHIPYPGASQDALRIKVKPQTGAFMESLAFYFPSANADRALLNLQWGETIVEVPIENTR
jgi:Protein of unknown function (DUF2911)